MSPLLLSLNPHDSKHFTSIAPSGRSAGRSEKQSEATIPDAELAALVAAWPTLPEPIKAAIRALVRAAYSPDPTTSH